MRTPVQFISKVLVGSLLTSVFFLESCDGLGNIDISSYPAEMQAVFIKMREEQFRREKELKDKEEAAQRKEEEQKQLQEKLNRKKEKIKQKEKEQAEQLRLEEERKQKEEKDRLEREGKERKRHEEEELKKKREAEEKSKNRLEKVRLNSEILRVAEIMQREARDPKQLEKTVEELTPHGKDINKSLEGDGCLGYSEDVFTDTDVAVLVNHPRLARIVSFNVDNLKLSKPQLKVLFSHLKDLRLKSSHLRKLRIYYEQLENVGVSNLLPFFQGESSSFSYLTLIGGNAQDDKGTMQDLVKYLNMLDGLQYLRFNPTRFPDVAPSLKFLPNLRYLNLNCCKIGDTGMQALAPCFKGITYLIGLDLSENNLGLVGAKALAAHLKDLPNLRTFIFDLNYNIELEGVQAIAPQLRHLAKLTGLSLHNTLNHTGAAGARALAPYLRDLQQLKMLNLQANYFGNEGLQALIPSLQNLPKLSFLDLTENDIVSAKSLVQYLNTIKKSEFHLYLGNNQLDDTGTQFFLNLSKDLNPCYIYIERNKISSEVASKLQQLSHVVWIIDSTVDHNPKLSGHTVLMLNVDNYATSSKESILGF